MGPGPSATRHYGHGSDMANPSNVGADAADQWKSVSWFKEENLSFTANKNLKCLNSHGEFVTATYRQNNLYYDCILDGMDKEVFINTWRSVCSAYRAARLGCTAGHEIPAACLPRVRACVCRASRVLISQSHPCHNHRHDPYHHPFAGAFQQVRAFQGC